ncbi:Abi-alpha family protein [Nocardioides silvaticus]|uniref:Abi-alpha family protein n=1 Tax=Nocardioides silvaticus TaxID=2201891 RepID=UPI001FE4EAF7|nr:Abi-alpha family protein [Nocardioides silvaticus]
MTDRDRDLDLDRDGLPRLPAVANGSPVAESLPGLARVAGTAALNTAGWGLRTTARNWRRVGRAATNRDEAVALIREVGTVVGTVGDIARQVADGVPVGTALLKAGEQLGGVVSGSPSRAHENGRVVGGEVTGERPTTLRERGQELLEKSRDVWATDDRHPAFDRILDDLAPDEARILVMLLKNGPQPSVDIRTGGPVGMVSSQLIAPGLNMVGARAGLRHLDQVPSYLNNLFRLGLVWFSREALRDHMEYQVLEAQPDVLDAMHSVKFAKVVRRSIHLTPFGEEFVKQALVDEVTAESPELPEHDAPPEGAGD